MFPRRPSIRARLEAVDGVPDAEPFGAVQTVPIPISLEPDAVVDEVVAVLRATTSSRLVLRDAGYLHAVVRAGLRRVLYDLEFQVDPAQSLLRVRCTPRTPLPGDDARAGSVLGRLFRQLRGRV